MKKIVLVLLAGQLVASPLVSDTTKPLTCLWIGCSATRAVAYDSIGLKPEELCVQHNLANLFVENDPSTQLALKHAVDAEKISQIVVCGTYGCPGVRQAIKEAQDEGSWLQSVRKLYLENKEAVDAKETEDAKVDFLVELNVKEQVKHLARSPVIKAAWEKKQPLKIVALVHDRATNKVKDLGSSVCSIEEAKGLG